MRRLRVRVRGVRWNLHRHIARLVVAHWGSAANSGRRARCQHCDRRCSCDRWCRGSALNDLQVSQPARSLHSHVWATAMDKPVSDRGTLEDLSQSRQSGSIRGRKLLILNGEMSEWLKEHAWKLNPVALNNAHQHASTLISLNDLTPQRSSSVCARK
jgi:hypothetical protein